jgi:outer membrane protein assembly factor BamB
MRMRTGTRFNIAVREIMQTVPCRRLLIYIGMLLTVFSPSLRANAENWPQWRGPKNNGVSSESGLPVEWSRDKNVAWRLALPGPAGSTPIVWKDRIFLTSADKSDLLLLCLRTDGTELWRRKIGTGNRLVGLGGAPEGNLASPSPSTDGQHVWAFFGTGDLACFDLDGNEKWHFNLQERYGPFDLQFGMHSTPVLHEDKLYLQVIHGPMNKDGEPAYVVAVDKATGKEIWKRDRKTGATVECKHSYASPIIYDDGKQSFLITHGGDYVVAHRLNDGQEIWRHGGMNPPRDFAAATGASEAGKENRAEAGGLVERFDTNRDGSISRSEIPEGPTRRVFDRLIEQHKLNPDKTYSVAELRTAIGAPEVAQKSRPSRDGYNQTLRFVASPVAVPGLIVVPSAKKGNVLGLRPDLTGDATDSKDARVWNMSRGTPDVPSPLVHDGLVYLVAEDGVLTCLDAKSGETLYRERLHSARHRASPVVAGDYIFVCALDGHVSVVKAGPKFERVAQNELGETVTASPAISGGTIYLRTFESLWAIRGN